MATSVTDSIMYNQTFTEIEPFREELKRIDTKMAEIGMVSHAYSNALDVSLDRLKRKNYARNSSIVNSLNRLEETRKRARLSLASVRERIMNVRLSIGDGTDYPSLIRRYMIYDRIPSFRNSSGKLIRAKVILYLLNCFLVLETKNLGAPAYGLLSSFSTEEVEILKETLGENWRKILLTQRDFLLSLIETLKQKERE